MDRVVTDLVSHPLFDSRSSSYIRWYPKTLKPVLGISFQSDETPRPTGLYIHVPFCDQICSFCPFNKLRTDPHLVDLFHKALKEEIALYGKVALPTPLQFIYFGGGTPSVLSPGQLEAILSSLDMHFGICTDAEITLEAHPRHLNRQAAKELFACGINRVSSGIQAFDDKTLQRVGAQHTSRDTVEALDATGNAFGSISIDLLYRCPDQGVSDWESQLAQIERFPQITHVSAYSLVLRNDCDQADQKAEAEMALLCMQAMSDYKFFHYASCASGGFDFAKEGRTCIYERSHWAAPQAQFLGLGPGAFGFVGCRTTVNGLEIGSYLDSLLHRKKLPIISATYANPDELMRRYFVLGVKTLEVPLAPFRELFGVDPFSVFTREFQYLVNHRLADITETTLTLTPLGRLFVDTISSSFFSPTEAAVAHPEEPEIRAVERVLRDRI